MRIEEEYTGVLQNIESTVVHAYGEHPKMTDYDVLRVYEVLADDYSGEKIGRAPRPVRLSETETALMGKIRAMTDWQLGKPGSIKDQSGAPIPYPDPITLDESIMCLKRLIKSAKMWNKEGGQRGYLDFIAEHVV